MVLSRWTFMYFHLFMHPDIGNPGLPRGLGKQSNLVPNFAFSDLDLSGVLGTTPALHILSFPTRPKPKEDM